MQITRDLDAVMEQISDDLLTRMRKEKVAGEGGGKGPKSIIETLSTSFFSWLFDSAVRT